MFHSWYLSFTQMVVLWRVEDLLGRVLRYGGCYRKNVLIWADLKMMEAFVT